MAGKKIVVVGEGFGGVAAGRLQLRQSLDADLVITIPARKSPAPVSAAGLAGPSGWVHVTPETLETDRPGVYTIGDVNNVPMANGRGLPNGRVFASSEGEPGSHNIAAAILDEEPRAFTGVGHWLRSLGGARGDMVRGGSWPAETPT